MRCLNRNGANIILKDNQEQRDLWRLSAERYWILPLSNYLLYRSFDHGNAAMPYWSINDRRCYECDSVLWTVYRCSTGIYHYRAPVKLQGLYFLIVIFILRQVDGNIIGPTILGDSTGLSPFWVVFAIMVRRIVRICRNAPWSSVFAVIYYIIQRSSITSCVRKKARKRGKAYIELDKVMIPVRMNSAIFKEEIDVKKIKQRKIQE